MGHLFWLSDEAWAAIEPQLPKNQPGARRVDEGWIDATVAIDSTYVKAHRSAHGGKGGRRRRPSVYRAVGRPRKSMS